MANLFAAISSLKALPWLPASVRDIRAFRVEQWSDFTKLVKSLGLWRERMRDRKREAANGQRRAVLINAQSSAFVILLEYKQNFGAVAMLVRRAIVAGRLTLDKNLPHSTIAMIRV